MKNYNKPRKLTPHERERQNKGSEPKSHKAFRCATEDELKQLFQCELGYADMGDYMDFAYEDNWQENNPLIALVFDDPEVCASIAGEDYQTLIFACWSSTFHNLYGWYKGELKPLPVAAEDLERYLL